MGKLSFIVAGVATAIGAKAWLMRSHLPLPAVAMMGQATLVGYCIALASSDSLAQRTTWILGKTSEGRFPWWSYPLFWPYHVGLRLKLHAQKRLSKEPVYNAVGEKGWYIGGWPRDDPSTFPPSEPAVLDCTCELPRRHTLPYLCLPTWDCQGPSPELIEAGIMWAVDQQRKGREVLVHCAHGHGRSCTVLCAALIQEGSAGTIDEALALVRQTRPLAKLNSVQRQALEGWLAMHEKKM